MKLIAVDVGNTSTAVGLWSNGRVSSVSHVDGDRTAAFAAAEALRARGAERLAYVRVVPRAEGVQGVVAGSCATARSISADLSTW